MVGIWIKKSGAWKAVSAISIYKAGAWKLVSGVGIVKTGAWKNGYGAITPGAPPLTLSVNNSTVSGSRSGVGNVTTNAATVSVLTGTPAYTYAWAKLSGNTFTIDSPTAASTTFSSTLTTAPSSYSGVYRCTVTDSAANSSYIDVTVNMTSGAELGLTVTINMAFQGYDEVDGSAVFICSAIVSGGNGSYSYTWSTTPISQSGNITSGIHSSSMNCYSFGTFNAICDVTDTSGKSGQGTNHNQYRGLVWMKGLLD